uniref:Uncharacterized protein n=1 Tax=Setaria viridis TaxID=4556 RepID=A0A4U6SZ36_SETVI|nr:hypothetical protein SEVIR_9G235775v2 [Setaria viridis]
MNIAKLTLLLGNFFMTCNRFSPLEYYRFLLWIFLRFSYKQISYVFLFPTGY